MKFEVKDKKENTNIAEMCQKLGFGNAILIENHEDRYFGVIFLSQSDELVFIDNSGDVIVEDDEDNFLEYNFEHSSFSFIDKDKITIKLN